MDKLTKAELAQLYNDYITTVPVYGFMRAIPIKDFYKEWSKNANN